MTFKKSKNITMATNVVLEGLVKYLNGVNEEEKLKIATAVNGIIKSPNAIPAQRKLTLKAYEKRLETKLSEENLRLFLEVTRCRHLFKLLYPNEIVSMSEEEKKWLEFSEDEILVETYDGQSTIGESDWGIFRDDLLRILETINMPDRNTVRFEFFTFLDLCWEAMAFDNFGKGNYDQVFDAENEAEFSTKNKIKPWDLRKIFLIYIQFYLSKQAENAALNQADFVAALDLAFKRTINTIMKSFDKILCNN